MNNRELGDAVALFAVLLLLLPAIVIIAVVVLVKCLIYLIGG